MVTPFVTLTPHVRITKAPSIVLVMMATRVMEGTAVTSTNAPTIAILVTMILRVRMQKGPSIAHVTVAMKETVITAAILMNAEEGPTNVNQMPHV